MVNLVVIILLPRIVRELLLSCCLEGVTELPDVGLFLHQSIDIVGSPAVWSSDLSNSAYRLQRVFHAVLSARIILHLRYEAKVLRGMEQNSETLMVIWRKKAFGFPVSRWPHIAGRHRRQLDQRTVKHTRLDILWTIFTIYFSQPNRPNQISFAPWPQYGQWADKLTKNPINQSTTQNGNSLRYRCIFDPR